MSPRPHSRWGGSSLSGTGVSPAESAGLSLAHRTFEIVIANAQHVKKVLGRKTDLKDAEWIAD
jgi:hypothetical protein